MKKLVLSFALAIGAFAVGCSPSPEKVCAHVIDIVAKEMKGDMKLTDEKKKKEQDDCVKKASEDKESDPEGWKCSSKCAMDAKDLDGMMKCDETCPNQKKKKKGGDDDGDKKKKKDDDSK